MNVRLRYRAALVLSANLCFSALNSLAQPDLSHLAARKAPDWVRDAVVYEVYPRSFSAAGNFNGITAKLDELKDLGVTVLW